MFYCFIFFFIFLTFNIFGLEFNKYNFSKANYIICIDGGGSKTSMQVINKNKNIYPLKKNNIFYNSIVSKSSNLNYIDKKKFKKVLDDLFNKTKINDLPFDQIIPSSYIIGGLSGGGSIKNLKKAVEQLKLKGFKEEQIFLNSDAHLALELTKPNGIILISGTGSIALGTENNKLFRAGGFGKLLNDKGNGYSMGILGIKHALEYEHGYGEFTILHKHIKKIFNVNKVYDLVNPIQTNKISQDNIAILSHTIFKHENRDRICKKIIQKSAKNLALLVINVLKQMEATKINIILVGGIFNQNKLIDQVFSNTKLKKFLNNSKKVINIQNMIKNNIALEFAKINL